MESPLARGKITLHGCKGVVIATELAKAQTLGSLCGLLPSVPFFSSSSWLNLNIPQPHTVANRQAHAVPYARRSGFFPECLRG